MIQFSYMLNGFSAVSVTAVTKISVELICELIWRDSVALRDLRRESGQR